METAVRPRSIALVDPEDVYAKHVAGRKVVYLDTNVWLALLWGETQEAVDCLDACRRRRVAGRVLFPLSYASVSELLEQPTGPHQVARADLMDELSSGVCLRAVEIVTRIETMAAIPVFFDQAPHEPARTEMFTLVSSRFGDVYLTDAPEARPEVLDQCLIFSRAHESTWSVRWLVERGAPERTRVDHQAVMDKHRARSEEITRLVQQQARDPNGAVNYEKALRIERIHDFQRNVWPAIAKHFKQVVTEEQLRAFAVGYHARGGLGRPGLRRLYEAMPATNLHVEIWARRAINVGRKYRDEDFWDTEHARVAGAYADAFVTGDGNLADILENAKTPARRGCTILRGIDALRTWLDRELPE